MITILSRIFLDDFIFIRFLQFFKGLDFFLLFFIYLNWKNILYKYKSMDKKNIF